MPEPIHYGPSPTSHSYTAAQLRRALAWMREHVRACLLDGVEPPAAAELAELGRWAGYTTCKTCGLESMAREVLEMEVDGG